MTFPNFETWNLHIQVLISVVNVLPLISGAVVQKGLDRSSGMSCLSN